jgi:hypothetical protein
MAMRFRFVLLGTNHPLHFGSPECSPAKVSAFRTYVTDLCKRESIKLIAEEACEDALKKHSVTETVAAKIARDHGLRYKMVDLSGEERSNLRIEDGGLSSVADRLTGSGNTTRIRERLNKLAIQVREATWIARVLGVEVSVDRTFRGLAASPALLIVGASHVKGLKRLMLSLGQRVDVAHPDYDGEE